MRMEATDKAHAKLKRTGLSIYSDLDYDIN
jgi:hypothetical protein